MKRRLLVLLSLILVVCCSLFLFTVCGEEEQTPPPAPAPEPPAPVMVKYKVEYYLENIEDDNYTLYETTAIKGLSETTATAPIKQFEHFTYDANESTISKEINRDGSTVLEVYYNRNEYHVEVENFNDKSGECTEYNMYFKYGKIIDIACAEYLGYTFNGWYVGLTCISTKKSFKHTVTQDINITALMATNLEMSNFEFTSTFTTCTITGVKDKTITDITIPNYVTSIGNYAFSNCSSLTSVTIPNSGTSIGSDAFSNCPIESATMPTSAISYIPKSKLKTVVITGGTSIGERAFYNCSSLTSVEIGNSVTSIGSSAFYNCDSLTSVVIGDSVTSIGNWAFGHCDSLTSVVIPDSVTSIGNYAFDYCDSLTSVVIGDSVTSIGDYAFSGCNSLTSITIGDSVTSIGWEAFCVCSSLTSVNYLGTIDSWAQIDFANDYANPLCYAKNLYINDALVTNVVLTTATKISGCAFYNCDSLTSVVIGDSVTSIGNYAFYYCSSLTSITIGDSVTRIGYDAFSICNKLTKVNYTGTIDEWVQISFGSGDANPISYAGNLYINNQLITKVNLTTATKVSNYAFYHCYSLGSVTLGNSVTSIGDGAFSNCSRLTSVTIPNSVTSIGDWAFYSCNSLTSVVIGDSVTSIGRHAFYDCDSLTNVTFSDTSDWYVTTSESDWQNKTGGTLVDVTNPTTNDDYLKSTYRSYYWYKK